MSLRDQTVRFRFQTLSELPTVIAQLEQINKLTEQQGKAASSSADLVKAALLQQRNDTRATAEESLAISKEIARQATLEKKAQLDIQTAQVKASEAQQTAFVQASEKERAALAEQIAKQSTNEQQAELKRRETLLNASEAQKTIIVKAEEERRTAAVRAALLEQAQVQEQIQNQATLELKAELNKRTIAAKAESDEQVAAFRQDQIRQTAILRGELAEQRVALKQQNAAYQELRGFIASAFGAYEVLQFTKDIVEAKSTVDSFRLGLQQMIGSKREADGIYVKLVELAKTTPFGITDIQSTTFSLKAMGVATNELLPTIEMLGNMAAVAGTDKLPLIAKAYTDIMSKGKLMKQEQNQMSENGINLMDLLQKSMGKTRDEVVKLAEAHQISFAQVKKALQDATSEGGLYYGQMAIASQTLGGQTKNLSDTFFFAKARLGDYYKDGLQRVITGLYDLTESLLGSESAITRNVAMIKAAAAAYLTYHGVANSAAITEGVMVAAVTAKNVVIGAGNLIMGTYNLVMIASVGTTDMFSAAQVRSAAAARSTWAALAANPLGAILAVLGLLTMAYYAYEAASASMLTAVGQEEVALRNEQKTINESIGSVLRLKEGTKERTAAIQALISKYPDYFAGMQAERVTNAQLRSMLDQVNGSYRARIALAKEAYRTELIEEQFKKVTELEAKVMAVAEARLGKEFIIKIKGDPAKLREALNSSTELMDKFTGNTGSTLSRIGNQWNDMWGLSATGAKAALDKVIAGNANYETEKQASDQRLKALQVKANDETIALEKKRHKDVLTQLKAANDGSAKDQAEYNAKAKQEEEKYQANLLSIKGESIQKEAAIDTTAKKAKAERAKLSAKEVNAILTQEHAETLFEQIKALDAQEKAEIEAANKSAKNKQQARAAILSIQQEYDKKESNLREAAISELTKGTAKHISLEEEAAAAVVSFAMVSAKVSKSAQSEINEAIKQTAKLRADLAEAESKQQNASAITSTLLAADTEKKRHDIIVEFGRKTGDDLNVLELVRLKQKKEQLEIDLDSAFFIYGKDSAEYRKAVANKLAADNEYSTESTQLQTQLSDKLIRIWAQQEQRKKQLTEEFIQSSLQSLQTFNQQQQELNDSAQKGYQERMAAELTAAGDNFSQREAIMANYAAKEEEALYSSAALSKATNYLSSVLTAFKSYTAAKQQIDQDYSSKVQEIQTTMNLAIANGLNETTAKKQAADDLQLASEAKKQQTIVAGVKAGAEFVGNVLQATFQLEAQMAQAQIQIETQKHEATKKLLDDRFAYETKVLDEATQAKQKAAQIDYEYNQKMIAQDLADAIAKKEAARAKEIADLNADYQAKIALAAGNKAEIERLEAEKTVNLKAINDRYDADITAAKDAAGKAQTTLTQQYTTQQGKIAESGKNAQVLLQQQLTQAKAAADADYDAKIRKLQSDQFNAQRSMAKAQIATALVVGAAQLFAINPILGIIGAFAAIGGGIYLFDKLDSIPNPYDGSTGNSGNLGGINGDGAIAYDAAGKPIYGFDKDGNPQYKNDKGELVTVDNEPQIKKQWRYKKQQLVDDQALLDQLTILLRENAGAAVGGDYYNETKSKIDKINSEHPNLSGEIERIKREIADFEAEMTRQGIKYYLGTESVDGPYKDGIDTVPAWLTKGERVLTVEQNKRLGGISNEDLVMRHQFFQSLDMSGINSRISLPEGVVGSDGTTATIDFSELKEEMIKTRQAIENQKLMNISIDRNGFSVSEIGSGSIVNHYSSLLKR